MKIEEPTPKPSPPNPSGKWRANRHRYTGIGGPVLSMRADGTKRISLHIDIDPDVLAALEAFAATHNRSVSVIVEGLARHFLGMEQLPDWYWLSTSEVKAAPRRPKKR